MKRAMRVEREVPTPVHREPGANGGAPAVLITGGAGFIGCNVAHRLAAAGTPVILLDNLSRAGVERNVEWLRATHGGLVQTIVGDVRDRTTVGALVQRVRHVFHFAAQVAVTTSLTDPTHDFDVNARGTLNVLEAIRACADPPSLLFTSTNKVYGALDDVPLVRRGQRYEPRDPAVRERGVGERRRLDFHSPYGCSKGTADQYVLDYARSYGLRTVVFRMSCIYGPHQFGTEDQGWVAHFLIRAIEDEPIVLYGDGMQVRDVLFVEDLVDAMLLAQRHADRFAGRAFNIGGGPSHTTSLLELLRLIGSLHGTYPDVAFQGWRTGDQRYYVSDTSAFQEAAGWRPRVDVRTGVERLYEWLLASRSEARRRKVARPSAAAVAGGSPLALDLLPGAGDAS